MQNNQQKLRDQMDKVLKMIDETIDELESKNEDGLFNHTIRALRKIRKAYVLKEEKKSKNPDRIK